MVQLWKRGCHDYTWKSEIPKRKASKQERKGNEQKQAETFNLHLSVSKKVDERRDVKGSVRMVKHHIEMVLHSLSESELVVLSLQDSELVEASLNCSE